MTESEYILSKSTDHTRQYCPLCEPQTDPLTELVTIWYCNDHCPQVDGALDRLTNSSALPLLGATDAGGYANRAWCNLLHRKELPHNV